MSKTKKAKPGRRVPPPPALLPPPREAHADGYDAHVEAGLALAGRGRFAEAAARFRFAIRSRPGASVAHYYLGMALTAMRDFVGAEAAFRASLRLGPGAGHVNAYLGLAGALAGQGRGGEAAYPLRRAVRLGLPSKEEYNEVGQALMRLYDFAGAEAAFRAALRPGPDVVALSSLANALSWLGRHAEALGYFRQALQLAPDCPLLHMDLGVCLLALGEYAEGFAEFEWRLRCPGATGVGVGARWLPGTVWDGGPLEGRTLLLVTNGLGLGDIIQFVRYATLAQAKGGRVAVECPGCLIPLLSNCAGIDALVAEGQPLPAHDTHLPLMSLPHRLGTTLATVPATAPYLATPPERVERWRPRVAALPGFRVGVVWRCGAPAGSPDQTRSAPLAAFAPLAAVPGVTLVSLQKGPGVEEIRAAPFAVVQFPDLDAEGGAFLDTAAVMQHLDLIISADSSPAHLAGALGVPVWTALLTACDWRWLTRRSDSPWYPTMRLFRQQTFGDWPGVFREMAEALRPLAGAKAGV